MKKNVKSVAFASFLALAANSYAAGITVDALKANSPPTIDGRLDDTLWQQGNWYTGFSVLNNPEALPEVQTHFKLAFDKSAVYVAVRSDEPDLAHQVKTVTERDKAVSRDDCIEIMLGADPNGSRYLHLIVNPLGTLYDAEIFNEGNEKSTGWNGDITVGVATETNAWTLELRIPLVEVGVTGENKGAWLLNVARERRTSVTELSSFVPLTGSFHQPSKYAALRLPDIDLTQFLWSVRYPYGFEFHPQKDALTCSAKTQIENRTGRTQSFLLRPKWIIDGQEVPGTDVPGTLDDEQKREVSFAFPVHRQGRGMLIIELLDQQHAKTLYAVRKRAANLKYVPIVVEILKPCYRNCIYATESVREIQAVARLTVPPERKRNAQLVATFAPQDQPDRRIAQATFPTTSSETEITMPISELKTGTYVLTVALQRDGNVFEQSNTVIKKLPPVPNEWRFDENNVFLHNGEPFLPFGWYSPPTEFMEEPDCPFTAAQNYSAQWYTIEELRERLDRYVAAGKVLTIVPYPNPKMVERPRWLKPLTDQEAEAIRQRVRGLKDHPGLFAWFVGEEPEISGALLERQERILEVVSQEDPYHPCIMLNDTVQGIYKYQTGGDVLMPDPYPCFLKNGLAALPIEKVGKFIRACRDATGGRKPAWVTPQAFNYGDYGRANNRPPTFVELRNMTHQATIEGAKGFIYYTWSHSLNYVDLQVGLDFLAKECADLKAAIFAPDAGDLVQAEVEAAKHLHCSMRRVDGATYIFAVNTATKAQDATFTFKKKPQGINRLYVVSENRSIPVSENGTFSDHFDFYGTHIYTSDARIARRETVAAAQVQIDRRDAAREKPGNLAFEKNGTTISNASKSRRKSVPDKLLDGIPGGMGWLDGTPNKCPDWVEVQWPKPVKIGRVVIVSDAIAQVVVTVPQVRAPQNKAWKEVPAVTDDSQPQITLRFPPVTTDRLRINVRKNRPGTQYTDITEIEAYTD